MTINFFLSMAIHREFLNDSETVSNATMYVFKESGNITIQEKKIGQHSLQERESFTDVTGNYDKFPEFGKYESIIRVER
ncbi:hypothetical protein [Xenorhabdus sp. TH1]|uniref:hypothetical protein n=1 Tax=Xenorhabdus sp. TH1 TaxID=3130166 RepID=UPI0030D4FF80